METLETKRNELYDVVGEAMKYLYENNINDKFLWGCLHHLDINLYVDNKLQVV